MTVSIHKTSETKGITATERAIAYIQKQVDKKPGAIGWRIAVSKRGCSGLGYDVSLVMQANEEDNIFEVVDGLKVFIDPKSFLYLNGCHVDFLKEGLNEKFIYTNPNQSGSCGCGESFTID